MNNHMQCTMQHYRGIRKDYKTCFRTLKDKARDKSNALFFRTPFEFIYRLNLHLKIFFLFLYHFTDNVGLCEIFQRSLSVQFSSSSTLSCKLNYHSRILIYVTHCLGRLMLSVCLHFCGQKFKKYSHAETQDECGAHLLCCPPLKIRVLNSLVCNVYMFNFRAVYSGTVKTIPINSSWFNSMTI